MIHSNSRDERRNQLLCYKDNTFKRPRVDIACLAMSRVILRHDWLGDETTKAKPHLRRVGKRRFTELGGRAVIYPRDCSWRKAPVLVEPQYTWLGITNDGNAVTIGSGVTFEDSDKYKVWILVHFSCLSRRIYKKKNRRETQEMKNPK